MKINKLIMEKPKQNFWPENKKSKEEQFTRKRPNEVIQQVKHVMDLLDSHEEIEALPGDPEQRDELRDILEGVRKKYLTRKGLLGPANLESKRADYFMKEIKGWSRAKPELLKIYTEILRIIRQNDEREISERLNNYLKDVEENPSLEKKLDEITIPLDQNLSEEQINLIRENFPGGNFLLHTTSVKNAGLVIESGQIMTSKEISAKRGAPWGRGARTGISFNMNDVRVLTGDDRHFMGFMVAPEKVLSKDRELTVPENSAVYEVRLKSNKSTLGALKEKIFMTSEESKHLPRIPLEETFVLCNEKDTKKIKKLLAGHEVKPKGILTYPNKKIRIESWIDPIGDHEIAGDLIHKIFKKADLEPSLSWKNLFPRTPTIESNTYVADKDISKAGKVVKTHKGLEIKPKSKE